MTFIYNIIFNLNQINHNYHWGTYAGGVHSFTYSPIPVQRVVTWAKLHTGIIPILINFNMYNQLVLVLSFMAIPLLFSTQGFLLQIQPDRQDWLPWNMPPYRWGWYSWTTIWFSLTKQLLIWYTVIQVTSHNSRKALVLRGNTMPLQVTIYCPYLRDTGKVREIAT